MDVIGDVGSPTTPAKKRKRLVDDLGRWDDVDCTPDTKTEMVHVKEKVNDLITQGSPTTTTPFLKWRLAVVESLLRLRAVQRKAISEAEVFFDDVDRVKADFLTEVKEDEQALLCEKTLLLSDRKVLVEDLNEIVTSKTRLEDAYITELRMSLAAASSSKVKLPSLQVPRLERKHFRELVEQYLGTKVVSETGDSQKWCNVLGFWLSSESVVCTHIIPYSWNTKEMAHMFGSDESPLTSRRNGISLQKKIEEAFDNCWIVIVPATSVQSTPTEWRVILLNTEVRNNTFFTDLNQTTDRRLWRWGDIDGRRLTFCNDSRPACRFLYLRYALAWLHAEDKGWAGFKEKVPPGQVWASPEGYLRKSILVELGRRTGDLLPKDLVTVGAFDDPDTSSKVGDEVAAIRVTERVQAHLDGMRDPKEEEESRE